jgi:starvation-inducible DNA-binding protein
MATKTSKNSTHLMRADIGIEDADRQAVVDLLQATLADAHVLYMKTRKYHWNVQGPRFHMLHLQFEAQYTLLEASIDEIAERIQMLACPAIGTFAEMLKQSQLKEQPGKNPPAQQMVADLLADHEAIIRTLRENIEKAEEHNDMGTSDFFTALIQSHEKMAWMLRATVNDIGNED